MESKLLRVFIAVVQNKSITLGAKKLKVSQTNVTLRIKQLEKNLGFPLFFRIPKGIILTKEGKTLFPLATEIIRKLDEAQIIMNNAKVQSSLVIASTFSNASIRLTPFLKKINKDFPNLELELITNNTVPIIELLLEYKVDIGFINHEPKNNNLIILNKFDNELLLIEPKNKKTPNVILAHEITCAFYNGMKEYCKYINNNEYKTIALADFETILTCVELGMGKSLLPKSIVEKFGYLNRVKITSIDKSIIKIETCLVSRKDNIPKINEYLKNMKIP